MLLEIVDIGMCNVIPDLFRKFGRISEILKPLFEKINL